MFAALMGARFLEAYYSAQRPGTRWAMALAARTAASCLVQGRFARWLFAPAAMELTVDGEAVAPAGYRLLVASVVRDVGIGMKVTWQAGAQPQRFHLIASGLSTTSMALQLPRVLTGRPLKGQPHVDRLARAARISFPCPQSYTLDGDLFRSSEIEIAIGPRLSIVRV
jgi:diacylglycerol kinase family enzyme